MIEPLNMEQAVIISAYTGFLICPFEEMHYAIEEKLGRSVFTHEMATPNFRIELEAAFKTDFLALLPKEAK